MNDLDITNLCAEAMGYRLTGGPCSEPAVRVEIQVELSGKSHFREIAFDPLHDDAQAMALVKKLDLSIDRGGQATHQPWWGVRAVGIRMVHNNDLNRAICECVAKMMKARHD